jgi:hypothetical protein
MTVGALANRQKRPIFATFSPYKINPFQYGPSIKMTKSRVFQHIIQEPEGFRTRGVDSAILHANNDLNTRALEFFIENCGWWSRGQQSLFSICVA